MTMALKYCFQDNVFGKGGLFFPEKCYGWIIQSKNIFLKL